MPRGLVVATLAMATFASSAAAAPQSSRPPVATGLNAAENRAEQANKARLEAKIAQLTRSTQLQASTIAGIAKRLDLAYPGLSEARLFAELDTLVERAVLLDQRLAAMQDEIDRLQAQFRDGRRGVVVLAGTGVGEGELSRSQALLLDARRAFDEGDFARAESVFTDLADILTAASADDLDLLFDVERARALSAELLGTRADRERASETRLDAIARRRERLKREALEIWQLGVDQVEADIETSARFGDVASLDRGNLVFERDVLTSVDRARQPREWGITKSLEARLAVQRAAFAKGDEASRHFNRAFDLYVAAVEAIDRAQHPLDYAEVQVGAAQMFVTLAGRQDNPAAARELLEDAIKYFGGARQVYDEAGLARDAGLALGEAAVAVHTLARLGPPSQYGEALDGAITLGRLALDRLPEGTADERVAMVRLNLCTFMQDRAVILQSDFERQEEALTMLGEARGHCGEALDFLSAERYSFPHASGRLIRASLGTSEAQLVPANKRRALLETARVDASAALDFFGGSDKFRPYAVMAQRLLDTISALER